MVRSFQNMKEGNHHGTVHRHPACLDGGSDPYRPSGNLRVSEENGTGSLDRVIDRYVIVDGE